MVPTLIADILIPRRLGSRDDAIQILDLISRCCPFAVPRRYGNTEPLRKQFDPSDPEEFLECWHRSVFWRGQLSTSLGHAFLPYGKRPMHASVSIMVTARKADVGQFVRFVRQGSVLFDVDFSFIYIPVVGDAPIIRATQTPPVATHRLVRYIPDLYWATVFGPPYIELFGKERLLSAPAPVVEELDESHIYIQLSESPLDLLDDFATVDKVRRRVKDHLNNDAFFDLNASQGHTYNAPKFRLPQSIDDTLAKEEAPRFVQPSLFDAEPGPAMEDAARDAVPVAKELSGVELDMSEASVESVERVLTELAEVKARKRELLPDEVDRYARLFGAYIGEVLRQRWRGEWYLETHLPPGPQIGLRIGSTAVFPVAKVYKRLLEGKGDDVWFYFQATSAILAEKTGDSSSETD